MMRPIVEVTRKEEGPEGAIGCLVLQKELFCVTLEPYNDKQIDPGVYVCERFFSPRFGMDTFKLKNVYKRTNIEFHPGNTVDDTQGCIIVAQYPGKLRGNRAVLNSGKTFKEFMRRLEGYDEIILVVKEDY